MSPRSYSRTCAGDGEIGTHGPGSRRDEIRARVFAALETPRPAAGTARDFVPTRHVGTPANDMRVATSRPERLLNVGEVRERLGGIGITLARRVLQDLPTVHIGDRVFVREATLDSFIVALEDEARGG
jgi:hypothetical protein